MMIRNVKPGQVITMPIEGRGNQGLRDSIRSFCTYESIKKNKYLVTRIHRYYIECYPLGNPDHKQIESFSFNDLVIAGYEDGDPFNYARGSVRRKRDGIYAYA